MPSGKFAERTITANCSELASFGRLVGNLKMQQLAGHKSAETTIEIYTHVTMTSKRNAVNTRKSLACKEPFNRTQMPLPIAARCATIEQPFVKGGDA